MDERKRRPQGELDSQYERKRPRHENTATQHRQWSTSDQARLNQLQAEDRHRQYLAQEGQFLIKQKRKAAEIRVKEGRAQPIDHLAANLRVIDPIEDLIDDEIREGDLTYTDPERIIDRAGSDQLEKLKEGIMDYLDLSLSHASKEYWQTIRIILEDKRRQVDTQQGGKPDSDVIGDVSKILIGKSYSDLVKLEKQILRKLDSDEPIDTEYWQHLIDRLLVYKARVRLRRLCHDTLQDNSVRSTDDRTQKEQLKANIVTETAAYRADVAEGLDEDEEVFAGEETEVASTHSKPNGSLRKPTYFNRVQMGYEWNKYNQTHYDQKNLPPKVVQGYKFHIFYPDLANNNIAPSYRITREGGRKKGQILAPAGEEDTCIIRFIAGPPYADIAFRIVDRDWDYSARNDRSFVNTFEDGKLTLQFAFKRIFYRK